MHVCEHFGLFVFFLPFQTVLLITMGVYEKVPWHFSRGKKVIRTRWIDTNKGDEANPDLRSRLVGKKEFADSLDPNLYAAAPPIEAMRFIVSLAATMTRSEKNMLMTIDLRRAYFHAAIEKGLC